MPRHGRTPTNQQQLDHLYSNYKALQKVHGLWFCLPYNFQVEINNSLSDGKFLHIPGKSMPARISDEIERIKNEMSKCIEKISVQEYIEKRSRETTQEPAGGVG